MKGKCPLNWGGLPFFFSFISAGNADDTGAVACLYQPVTRLTQWRVIALVASDAADTGADDIYG